MTSVYDFSACTLGGEEISLETFRGDVLLVVNVASQCGFTPQYAGLEALYRKYKDQGFAVLGFPCNQFGGQEPGGAEEIGAFCSTTYDVSFPLFAKVDVNGPNTHPLYAFLKHEKRGLLGSQGVKWNFTKFGVGRDGRVAARWGSNVKPEALEGEVVKLLEA